MFRRRATTTRRVVVIAALTGAAGLSVSVVGAEVARMEAIGQQPGGPSRPNEPDGREPERVVAPGEQISGRDFAGLRLQIATQSGPLELVAQRAIVWTEEPPAGSRAGSTVGAPVQRMILQGDVRVRVGLYRFGSAKAVVWLEPVENSAATSGPRAGKPMYQIAIYFDRVGDPAAEASASQSGDRLLVTAVVDAEPVLSVDLVTQSRSRDPLVIEGERRLAKYLDALANPSASSLADAPVGTDGAAAGTSDEPRVSGILVPGMSQPYEPGSPLSRGQSLDGPTGPSLADRASGGTAASVQAAGERRPEMFSMGGTVTIAAGEPVLMPMGDERVLMVTGGVVVQYSDPRQGRSLQLSAQRAVIFFEKGPLEDLARSPAERVKGMYLEGDVVASDGKFNTRANQVYYDLRANRALLIDGVFWTYDQARQLPLYVRAQQIRQTAANQIEAHEVRMAASAFFTPQLSLAARDLTITREPASEESPNGRTTIAGTDLTARAGNLPFFYWPGYSGDVQRFPLRDIRAENSSSAGLGVKTRWDILGILGIDTTADVRADLLVDGWLKRGVAFGIDSDWRLKEHAGSFVGYIVPNDRGTDQLASGVRRGRNGEARGLMLAEDRWTIDKTWSLFSEAAYLGDENFADAYYQTEVETRREFASGLALQGIDGHGSFLVEVKHNFNDFTANQYLLESKGYTVSKLPELRYYRVGDDVFASAFPGMLTWNHEYRVSRMAMRFTSPTAAELGFDTVLAANDALGINPQQAPADRLAAMGFINSDVLRADTRQELTIDLSYGAIKINPFVVGRATAWSKRFENVASAGQDDRARLWAAGGLRASTTAQRVYDDFNIPVLDIHRVRHIVTPSVTVWAAGSNRSQNELPTYDELVEALNEGETVRAGIMQVFQTQRGATGRQLSVDFLKVNTDVVISSNSTDRRSPLGRFFDDRPEYAALGKYATGDFALQLTDALAITGTTIFDLDLNQQARSTIGMSLEQSRDLSAYIELRFLHPRNATYLAAGADMRLTELYTLGTQATFDTNKGRIQTMSFRLSREFPAVTVAAKIGYNDITRETTFGFAVTPLGKDRRVEMLANRLGRDQVDRDLGLTGEEPTRLSLPGEK